MRVLERRWLLALLIIMVVVTVSAGIVLSFRDKPSGIPMSAISDGSGGAIIVWQGEKGIHVQHINDSGQPLWKEGGIQVSEASGRLDPYAPPQTTFTLVADGAGGAIITWDDKSGRPKDWKNPAYYDPIPFYSQRTDSNGEFLWKDVVIASGDAGLYGGEFPIVVADGTGGAIFAWNNYKTYFRTAHDDYLRLQKLGPDGSRLWGDEGKLLVTSSPYRPLTEEEIADKGTPPRSLPTYAGTHDIVSDGSGGCIVIWEEEGEKSSYQVFARRLDSDGNPVWDTPVTVGSASYLYRSLVSDGSGGAILTLTLGDNNTPFPYRINSVGDVLSVTTVYTPATVNDGFGGSIRVRVEADPLFGPPYEKSNRLYVQRFDAAGNPLWPEQQVLATPERYQIGSLEFAADGTGGIILLWQLQKESVSYGGIFARRLDAEGNIRWDVKGLAVFNRPDKYQGNATILSDGSGGALIIAIAGRNALGGDMVYAQHLDAAGNRLWGNGVRIDR
jgi:hypothetical protein